jgi:hypothetical protein
MGVRRRMTATRSRRLIIAMLLASTAAALVVLSLAAPVHPCDNADARLRLAAAAAFAAALAVLALRWSSARRWLVAASIGVLLFGSIWLYSLLTTDYSCLN